MNKILKILGFKPNLSREALVAHLNKLPDNIEVDWFRNGDLIVGKVIAGEHTFMTQGKNAKDFIEMVNDGVNMINRIPKDYRDVIIAAYKPPLEEIAKLENKDITKAFIFAHKNNEVLQTA